MEKCAICGAAPEMENRRIEDAEGVEFQRVPWRCSNTACENRDPRNHDFEWLVPA